MVLTPVRAFLSFFFLVSGGMCVESNMYGRSFVFPYYLLMSTAKLWMVHKVRSDVNASNLTCCMFLWVTSCSLQVNSPIYVIQLVALLSRR